MGKSFRPDDPGLDSGRNLEAMRKLCERTIDPATGRVEVRWLNGIVQVDPGNIKAVQAAIQAAAQEAAFAKLIYDWNTICNCECEACQGGDCWVCTKRDCLDHACLENQKKYMTDRLKHSAAVFADDDVAQNLS